jgi:hypothetical protein
MGEGRKEEEGRPLLAWRTAALRMRDNMAYRGSVQSVDRQRYFWPHITHHPELVQSQNGYKVADYSYNLS